MGTPVSPTSQINQTQIDSFYAQQDQEQNQRLLQSVSAAADVDPNAAGEAQRLGIQTGVGPDIALRNMAIVRKQAQVQNIVGRNLPTTSPVLARALSDPSFSAIAYDQVDNLSATEALFKKAKAQGTDISNQWEVGQLQHEMGLLGFKAGSGQAAPEDWDRINAIKQRLSQIPPQRTFLGGAANMAGMTKDMGAGAMTAGILSGMAAGGATAWASGGLAAEAVPEATMLGFKFGSGLFAAQDTYRMTAGQAYLSMLEKGVQDKTAQYAAAGVGAINTALMMGGVRASASTFGNAFNNVLSEKLAEQLTRPTVARAVQNVVGRWALNTAEGGTVMAGQEVVSRIGEDLAKSYDKGQLETAFQTPEGREELANRVVGSFLSGAELFGVLGAPSAGMQFMSEANRAGAAARATTFFNDLSSSAEQSEVRKRNPGAYERFIAKQADGTGAEHIYIDGQQMVELLHQSGAEDKDLDRVLPGVRDQIVEAAATGGDVTIPTSQYAANLAGTELGKAMLPHMRLDPNAMSAAEAEEFAGKHQEMMAEAKQQAETQTATNDEFAKSAKRVEGNIFDQLKGTKTMPDDVARTNAQLMRDLVVTSAADLNVTPEQFYEKYKPSIERATGGGLEQANRGGFDASRLAILLNDKADFSTFAHETAHYYLTVLGELAKDETAPGRFKHDMGALLDWFGVKDQAEWDSLGLEGQRKHHEAFAYSFEKYLAEGKAPSLETQGVFDRFSNWLKRIYVSIRDDLNSVYRKQHGADLPVMTGEVRDVMDRMLASDEQIKEAQTVRNMEPMFRSPEEAGMNPGEWAAYQDMHREATGSAAADLSRASIRQMQWLSNAKGRMLKELQKQHDALRASVREEVAKEVQAEHEQKVIADTGLPPELANVKPDAKAMKAEIDARTDQRMLERHGDFDAEDEVNKALHNQARAKFVAVELRHLTKATEPVRVMQKAAELAAEKMLADKPMSEVSPHDHSIAEARAARTAIDAMKKGDSDVAAKAKQNQLIQNALAKQAIEIRAEADKKLKYLSKFDNPSVSVTKAIGADYMDRINELLAGYELSRRAPIGDAREDISSWVRSEYAKTGIMPAVKDDVIAQMGTMHWKDMSINQIRDLHDAVKSLDYVGRRRTDIEMEGKRQSVDELIQEVRANLADVPHTAPVDVRPDLLHAKGLDKMGARFMSLKSGIRSMDAALVKMEQLFQWIDAGKEAGAAEAKSNGPMQRLFQLASKAEGKERGMRAESARAMRALGDTLKDSKINLNDALDVPELPRPTRGARWYREELIAMALNMGNAGNKEKMLKGYGWNEYEAVGAINRLLSKTEMDFVQGVWNHIGTYGEDIVEQQRRQTGVSPKMVEPTSLTTKWGDYKGGYYPVVFDSFQDAAIEQKQARNADTLFENNYSQASTNKGHTVERTGYVGPIHLSLGVIPRHLDQVTHDLAWREPIADMNKVLTDPRLQKEINETYGKEYSKQLRPWLQAMANDKVFDTTGDSQWEKMFRKVRSNATVMGIGFRLSTMAVHGTSALSNSLGEVGAKWFAKGAAQFAGMDRIRATRDFIFERSPEMAHRMDSVDRNIQEAINEINSHESSFTAQGVASKLYDNARRFSMYGVSMLDMASAMPTWMGAYLKGLAKSEEGGLNLSEADAIEYADRAVRNAHGGGGIKDLSQIQRDKGIMSLATMFYSFWNHMYNRQRDLAKGYGAIATGQASVRNLPRLLARSWFYFVVPQLAHALLKPKKDNDGTLEGFAKQTAEEVGLGFVSGVPAVRDLANAYVNGRDYTITPLEKAGRSIVGAAVDATHLVKGEPMSKNAVTNAAEAAGYTFGIPVSQPAATTRFLWDVVDGEQNPEDLKEWWNGVTTGKIR